MDNKNGGQGSAAPSWNAWAAAARNKTVNSGTNSQQPTVLTSEQLSARQQQKTVTDLARKKLLEAYKATAQGQGGDGAKPTAKVAPRRATTQDWQKYHSAWQNYYQKYYGEYYGKAAQDYIAREKMKMERDLVEKARKNGGELDVDEILGDKEIQEIKEIDTPIKVVSEAPEPSSEQIQQTFRDKIRKKAELLSDL